MGSKGRAPPPHLRRPLPGPGIMHPDPFGLGIHPPPGAFPPFDMLPPPEIMEQKLAAQHVEMQTLAAENQRLAATHTTLRQELAAAQQELQRLQAQIGGMKTEKEQQMRGLMDKIAKMEVNLQTTEPVKLELQQARADAQSLIGLRQELISKVQQLSQDLQRSHGDVQQIPALMSELEGLKQEYQHCRATYDYEKKLYHDHLESLQVMEKNYVSMAREVEKLRAELSNTNNLERRTGVPYGTSTGYKENEAAEHHPVGQNAYEGGYGVPQEISQMPKCNHPRDDPQLRKYSRTRSANNNPLYESEHEGEDEMTVASPVLPPTSTVITTQDVVAMVSDVMQGIQKSLNKLAKY
ncbi:protein FLX-like 2 isoform X2 [Macadamia integrifolia]|uniref:protein FLX-like 2 isoform X2 n=1 Tax=Macadamia integrifolia TaxID=60698 RepID=UPI001C4F15B2|nr:protein FLX-like 2 isoform X2 [Macadamia integrifolia]